MVPKPILKRACADQIFYSRCVKAALLLLLLVAGFCFFPSSAMADENAAEEKESPTSDARISIPVAEGEDVLGIRIPHNNEHGELVMLITADLARRVDEKNIAMDKMQIDFYDDERRRMEVRLPKSNFNMESRILSGNDGAVISRDDFTIVGEALEFDLVSQSGTMRGEVTMTISQIDIDPEP